MQKTDTGVPAPADRGVSAPRLSVVVTSYNHEDYLRQCLDSYLAQQVDFPIEIIVADDASTDSTPAIIAEYATRHPAVVRPILRPENLGLNRNLGDALVAARGEYVTLCDADDYVTDPHKLGRQVAYLDEHPETSVSFHPVRVVWEGDDSPGTDFPPLAWRDDFSLMSLVARNFIQVNSAVYRRLPSYIDVLPVDLIPQDWYLHILHARQGDIAMMPETMSVYRRHDEGMFALSHSNPVRFWARHGAGHAAFCEAVLDLFPGDSEAAANLTSLAARDFGALAAIADDPAASDHERALLAATSSTYPRAGLLAVRGQQLRITELTERLVAAKDRISQLESAAAEARTRVRKQRELITSLKNRNLEQRMRIKKLRQRLARQQPDLKSLRERSLRFKVSRLHARVRPDRTA